MRTLVAAWTAACLLLAGGEIAPVSACSNFCLDTPDGPVFGCTLDLFTGDGLVFVNPRGVAKESPARGIDGEAATWISEFGSVTFNLAGRESAFGGMNEAGLVVSTMELLEGAFPEPDERPPFWIGVWAQYILDTCDEIDEVVERARTTRIQDSAPPTHYLIADADGNCVAIEWLDGELVTYRGDTLPVKAMTNISYGRALDALERGGFRWWQWREFNPGRSAQRFAGAHERNQAYDASRDPDAVSYAFGTLIDVVGMPNTKWSIVYNIAEREIWFGTRASQAGKHLSLHAFDFSCEAPPLMLDVNVQLEGNVEHAFGPYDHDINLAAFRGLCAGYNIDVSEELAIELVEHFESFECAEGERPVP
jgi:choloylglycine hydrolase